MPQCLLDSPKVLYSEGSIDRKPLSLSGLRLGLGFAVRLTFGLSHLWTINTINATMNHNSKPNVYISLSMLAKFANTKSSSHASECSAGPVMATWPPAHYLRKQQSNYNYS